MVFGKNCLFAVVLMAVLTAGMAISEPVALQLEIPGAAETGLPDALVLPLALPGESPVTLHTAVSNWVTFAALELEIALPDEAPGGLQILFHVVDWDGFWHQKLLPLELSAGSTNLVTIDVSPVSDGWEPLGHYGAWHRRSLMKPGEVGFRVFGKSAYTGACEVVAARGLRDMDQSAPVIRHIRANNATPEQQGFYELRFDMPDRYANPFDPREVAVDATITLPSGKTEVVPAFYYQDYFRTVAEAGETILPQGRPEWRLRYSPHEAGEHSVVLQVKDRFGSYSAGAVPFRAVAANNRGVVRVAASDWRFMEYSNGEPYFPIGHNIRSPFDTRMDDQFPWRFRHPEGSAAYKRYFKDMAQAGANLVEVWAAAWSLGLEWSETQLGYHGVGQYNLVHAWELDHVFRIAGEHNLNVNLVLNNHGRLSSYCDPEWGDNPFNVFRGGHLKNPMDWFSDQRSMREYEQQLRYLIARYAWNPHLFAWELWSELNLAGNAYQDRPHHDPNVIAWHRRMGQYLQRHDYGAHLISTHVSNDYRTQSPDLVAIPELTLAVVDAYHGSRSPLQIVQLQVDTADYNAQFRKPVLVTEFGGSPMAADLSHLRREVHAALWSSVSTAVTGTPLFWWWQVIEEENFYPMYQAVSRFMEGEDRRDPELQARPMQLIAPNGNQVPISRIAGTLLISPSQGFGWIYQTFPSFSMTDPTGKPEVEGMTVRLPAENGAIYRIEFWDTQKGAPISREDERGRGGHVEFAVPAFARDIAFKVKRRAAPVAVPDQIPPTN